LKRNTLKSVANRHRWGYFASIYSLAFKETTMNRTIALGIVIMVTLLLVSGCNTIRGAGEDLQQGGEAIQRAAS
jgi:predicted small secreted protein